MKCKLVFLSALGLISLFFISKLTGPPLCFINKLEPGNVVKIQGIVINENQNFKTIYDGTGYIRVRTDHKLKVGDLIEVIGTTKLYKRKLEIIAAKISLLT